MTTGHGFEFAFGDAVEFIDAWAEPRSSLHFSEEEFNAFVRGVQAGDFDVEGGAQAEEA